MADDPSNEQPPGYQFTLNIITPDGKAVFSVDANQLPAAQWLQGAGGNDQGAIQELLRLNAPIAHIPYKQPGGVALLGTFYINLSVYNPDKK